MNPKISIIVPVYNVEDYVEDCLRSVMSQTYMGEMECLLVDDCGTDNSMKVVGHLLERYDGPVEFRILRHERNRGVGAARNTGTKAATGDYVFYLDSDDYISNDCIEMLVQPLKENPYDIVVGDYFPLGGKEMGTQLTCREGGLIGKSAILEVVCKQEVYVMVWNKLVSRDLIEKYNIQFLEAIIHEDIPWSFAIACVMNDMCVVHKTTYYYRKREDSIMLQSKKRDNDNLSREFYSYSAILLHVLDCAKQHDVGGKAFDAFALYLFDTVAHLAFSNKVSWIPTYRQIRKAYVYPFESVHGRINEMKAYVKLLHWKLPPFWGYVLLAMRYSIKNWKKSFRS